MELNVTEHGLEVKAQNKTELYAVKAYLSKNAELEKHIVFIGDNVPAKEDKKVVPEEAKTKKENAEPVKVDAPEDAFGTPVVPDDALVDAPAAPTVPAPEVRSVATPPRDKERADIVTKLNKAGISYDKKQSTERLKALYEEKTAPNLKQAPKTEAPKTEAPTLQTAGVNGVSQTEVFSKLKNFALKHGGDMAKTHIMSKFAAAKFSEIPADRWPELSKTIDEVSEALEA